MVEKFLGDINELYWIHFLEIKRSISDRKRPRRSTNRKRCILLIRLNQRNSFHWDGRGRFVGIVLHWLAKDAIDCRSMPIWFHCSRGTEHRTLLSYDPSTSDTVHAYFVDQNNINCDQLCQKQCCIANLVEISRNRRSILHRSLSRNNHCALTRFSLRIWGRDERCFGGEKILPRQSSEHEARSFGSDEQKSTLHERFSCSWTEGKRVIFFSTSRALNKLLDKCGLFVLLPCPKWRRIHRNRLMQGSSVNKGSNWYNSILLCRELLSSDSANQRCCPRSIDIRTTRKTAIDSHLSTAVSYFDFFRYARHGKMFVVPIEFNAKWGSR